MFVSLIGTWIQYVAQSWLVFRLSNSAFLLGLVGFFNAMPILFFSFFAGVIADRFNKKSILIITQFLFMVLAFILAFLTSTGKVLVWHIMIMAILNGLLMAFDAPARQSMVLELVGKKHLMNAIALNSASFNGARMIGPALAGILIGTIGIAGCFYINGISFFTIIIALFLVKNEIAANSGSLDFGKDIKDGLKFIKNHKTILTLLGMVAVPSLFGLSYMILMPIFAENILNVGAKGLGFLMSAVGLGALFAALNLARLGDYKYKGKLLVASSFVFSISLMLFAISKRYELSLFALLFVGWSGVTSISIVNTLLQIDVPDEFRGRVMSAFMFTFAGLMPFGNFMAGALANIIGAGLTTFIFGLVCAVFFGWVFLKNKTILNL